MQQIINFVIRYKVFLFFIFLFAISLLLTIVSNTYQQSKFLNSANRISGNFYKVSNNTVSYFGLREENERLSEENQLLRDKLYNRTLLYKQPLDSTEKNYTLLRGKAIKNSFANQRNYITIDKGSNDSVKQDMGVITAKGILGIIENTSSQFASVQSILNEKSNINAKIKNTNHFGSLVWNTKDYSTVQLVDIPRLVPLNVGDTIVTGAMSSIFPENIPIGKIISFDLDKSKSFYYIDVQLFNDMTNIGTIYIIDNLRKTEIQSLEKETELDD